VALSFTAAGQSAATWRLICQEKGFVLRSHFVGGTNATPLVLEFDQKANHATLLGLIAPGERRMALPCVLHLPDMGSVRITSATPGLKLDYDARRRAPKPFVRIAFPPATAAQPQVDYRFDVAAIYPPLPGIEQNALYDGFRRDWQGGGHGYEGLLVENYHPLLAVLDDVKQP
jgi:hypothetical protein